MLAWGWHPTLPLYWLICIMPMLATDVEPIFHQCWLNRNKKKVFLANWIPNNKRKWPRIIKQLWKNSRKLTTTIYTAFAKMLEKHWQRWQSVGKFADVLPTPPTDGQQWLDLACLLGIGLLYFVGDITLSTSQHWLIHVYLPLNKKATMALLF